jgi:hypothetical protein
VGLSVVVPQQLLGTRVATVATDCRLRMREVCSFDPTSISRVQPFGIPETPRTPGSRRVTSMGCPLVTDADAEDLPDRKARQATLEQDQISPRAASISDMAATQRDVAARWYGYPL